MAEELPHVSDILAQLNLTDVEFLLHAQSHRVLADHESASTARVLEDQPECMTYSSFPQPWIPQPPSSFESCVEFYSSTSGSSHAGDLCCYCCPFARVLGDRPLCNGHRDTVHSLLHSLSTCLPDNLMSLTKSRSSLCDKLNCDFSKERQLQSVSRGASKGYSGGLEKREQHDSEDRMLDYSITVFRDVGPLGSSNAITSPQSRSVLGLSENGSAFCPSIRRRRALSRSVPAVVRTIKKVSLAQRFRRTLRAQLQHSSCRVGMDRGL
mmetsp:Transcript_22970/g.39415  ORF Transcript_22970/g.39415 Transcript_22970/m.39415 type:complete len:267 (-) Transcript_22970:805-1605(-)